MPVHYALVHQWARAGAKIREGDRFWTVFVNEVPVLRVQHKLSPFQMARVTSDEHPIKLLLYDSTLTDMDAQWSNLLFLSRFGVGVWIRGQGWVLVPHQKPVFPDLSPQLRLSRGWTRDNRGIYWKKCRGPCQRTLNPEEFPKHGVPNRLDLYRNLCKLCYAASKKRLRA